jgi:hypothetical protein
MNSNDGTKVVAGGLKLPDFADSDFYVSLCFQRLIILDLHNGARCCGKTS